MFDRQTLAAATVALLGCFASSSASAHFILSEPKSMMAQNFLGDPQKTAPCGPDSMPTTPVGEFTEVKAGDMLHVAWDVTIPHGGHYRIALDKDPKNFVDPPFTDPVACSYDLAAVPKGPHDNVLMDGISADALSQDVKLPDEPCDDCTLQVIMVMQDHGPPNCIYYHCARLKILPKDGSTGTPDAGMTGGTGSMAGAGGMAGANMGTSGSAGGMVMTGGSGGGGGMAGSTPAMGMAGQGAPPPGNTGTPPATMGGTPPAMMMQGVTGAGGMQAAPATNAESDDGGCAVAASGSGSLPTWSSIGLALALLVARRRRLRTQ